MANDHVQPLLAELLSVNNTLTELENVNSLATPARLP
jgi:hypothetical protein